MKFKRLHKGRYISKDGRFEVSKRYGVWWACDHNKTNEFTGYGPTILGCKNTLREAKELFENA